jgi:hypothetical protein
MENSVESRGKYAFIRIDEKGVKVRMADSLIEFRDFNHYGITPEPKDIEALERYGVAGWTGCDTWYYIMQHDTWRYMNASLRIDAGKAVA